MERKIEFNETKQFLLIVPYGGYESEWFEVLPVKWLIDEKRKVMLADKVIFSGVPFDNINNLSIFPYNFQNSIIKKFMDNYLAKNLEQSDHVILLGKQMLYSFLTQKELKKKQRVEENIC